MASFTKFAILKVFGDLAASRPVDKITVRILQINAVFPEIRFITIIRIFTRCSKPMSSIRLSM